MRKTVRTADRPEHEILGRILRECRVAAGLSQRRLATELERTQSFVWKVESGVQHVDIPTLFDVAELLGTTPEDLMARLRSELLAVKKQ